jgi:hypothetical protein
VRFACHFVGPTKLTLSSRCACSAPREFFFFSAAFPFVNNVDEQVQLDLVVKYALGHVPQTFEQLAPESAALIARYESPEFFLTPERAIKIGFTAPLWKQPEQEKTIAKLANHFQSDSNFESSQPPLYYALAGLWFDVGRVLKFSGARLLYWVRFLNCLLVAALVWLAFVAAHRTSDNPSLYLSVPLLIAFIPQDAFYSIENDNASTILGAAAFILLLRWMDQEESSLLVSTLTGLTIAAAYLTKLANLAFIAVVLVTITVCAVFDARRRSSALIVFLTSLLPSCLWMWWCENHFGDLTGTSGKIAALTWTRKPIGEWWSHPIFTPHGTWIFLSDLLARLWRGEFIWHGKPLASPAADLFYATSSIVFPTLALTDLQRRVTTSLLQKRALLLCAVLFLASITFLALLSIQFDFGRCPIPQKTSPYLTAGRLMMVGLIPFAILYVHGIACALRWLRAPVSPLIVVGVIVLFVAGIEIVLSREVFASVYNWFHL